MELRKYLEYPTTEAEPIFQWWHRNSAEYPQLWCMARDYCSIPGVLYR